MNVQAYLERIGASRPRAASAGALAELHERHLLSVPFENLDIHLGERIVLDESRIEEKIVARRRGGFCYELNGLFALLLRQLGYRVDLLSAGVARSGGGFGPDADHLALRVEADGLSWLADVGFGDSFVRPLRLLPSIVQHDPTGDYRLEQDGVEWLLLRRRGEEWADEYRFTLAPRPWSHFDAMCVHHQTSPDSSFTRAIVCSLATPAGRITLSGTRLITTHDAIREESELSGDAEVRAALRDRFGVRVEEGTQFRRPV